MAAAFGYAAARYPMLPHAARPGLAALLATLLACTSSYRRCQPGYEQVPGSAPLQCRLADAGADADVGDGGGDADVARPMCGDHVCDDPGDGVDTNGDMVDGESSDTVFVAEGGTDMATGATRDQPVRTLPMGLQRAREMNRGTILVESGIYDTSGAGGGMERPSVVDRTVRIFGRYARGAGPTRWVARDAMGDSQVVGPTAGLYVEGASGVVLDGMTFEGQSVGSDISAYGLVARNAPGLVVRDSTVRARVARPGDEGAVGSSVSDGVPGRDGMAGGVGGAGGGACGMDANGGGNGGTSLRVALPAEPASAGGMVAMRAGGFAGPAGTMADDRGQMGGRGQDGAAGRRGTQGGLGLWTRNGFFPQSGAQGEAGQAGTGGGGGGAGLTFPGMLGAFGGGGGGGGGGACGGGGGSGGEGGGASVGVYLVGNTTAATFTRCLIFAGNGGNGGAGGAGGGGRMPGMAPQGGGGGRPGPAGSVGTSFGGEGGTGGAGGNGGFGGRGGAGLGGPSVGVMRIGGATVTLDEPTRTAIMHGTAGAHGMGFEGTPVQLAAPQGTHDEDMMPSGDGGTMGDAAADAAPDASADVAADAAADAPDDAAMDAATD